MRAADPKDNTKLFPSRRRYNAVLVFYFQTPGNAYAYHIPGSNDHLSIRGDFSIESTKARIPRIFYERTGLYKRKKPTDITKSLRQHHGRICPFWPHRVCLCQAYPEVLRIQVCTGKAFYSHTLLGNPILYRTISACPGFTNLPVLHPWNSWMSTLRLVNL